MRVQTFACLLESDDNPEKRTLPIRNAMHAEEGSIPFNRQALQFKEAMRIAAQQ
jgi:hypothetical protein